MPSLPPILAVDDTPDDLFFLKRLLVRAGVKNLLVTLEDGAQAQCFLSALDADPKHPLRPCVVFTDLKMPSLDGLELTRWIRTQPAFANLKVVMLSNSCHERDVKAAREARVDHYFEKFPVPEILAKIVAEADCL